MTTTAISPQDYSKFQHLFRRRTGISLHAGKEAMLVGRLAKRLAHLGLSTYAEYHRLLESGNPEELQVAVDLITTNETYFFREPKHFDFLKSEVLPQLRGDRLVRMWSAACSRGQEPYTLAMLLGAHLGATPWEILASDISSRVLASAAQGIYQMSEAERIPAPLLKQFCRKGVGSRAGSFLVERDLRSRVAFALLNLVETLPDVGEFDVIFLRNVMIYFDAATKRKVVGQLASRLRPDGYFLIGHSESLFEVSDDLQAVRPSIYRKPA